MFRVLGIYNFDRDYSTDIDILFVIVYPKGKARKSIGYLEIPEDFFPGDKLVGLLADTTTPSSPSFLSYLE